MSETELVWCRHCRDYYDVNTQEPAAYQCPRCRQKLKLPEQPKPLDKLVIGCFAREVYLPKTKDYYPEVMAEVKLLYTREELTTEFPNFELFWDEIDAAKCFEVGWNSFKRLGIEETYRKVFNELTYRGDQ